MLISEKNSTYLYVVNANNGFTSGQEYSPSELPAGAAMVATQGQHATGTGGKIVYKTSIASVTTPFQIFYKTTNGELKVSPVFRYSDIKSKGYIDYSAPVQQVTYVGASSDTAVTGFGSYNSSTDIIVGNTYSMNIVLDYTRNVINNTAHMKPIMYYATTTSQADMATGFYDCFLRTFVRDPFNTIRCDRVVGGTFTAFVQDATVTNGSKTITFAGNVTVATNRWIRIRGVAYKVASGTTTTSITIDRAYTGSTETIDVSVETTAAGLMNDTGNTFGLKFTGLDASTFNPKIETYEVVRFTINTNELYTERNITATYATAASEGSGYWMAVKELENYAQGNDKMRYFADDMTITREYDTSSSKSYNMLSLNFNQTPYVSPTTGIAPNNTFTIILALATSLNDKDELDVVFGYTD